MRLSTLKIKVRSGSVNWRQGAILRKPPRATQAFGRRNILRACRSVSKSNRFPSLTPPRTRARKGFRAAHNRLPVDLARKPTLPHSPLILYPVGGTSREFSRVLGVSNAVTRYALLIREFLIRVVSAVGIEPTT